MLLRPRHPSAASAGYTLVELMVSITISVAVLVGLVGLFSNNSRTRSEIERANQQTENGSYALQVLTDDLRNAGYLGTLDPTPLATPGVKPDACATDLPTLQSAMVLAVQGYDNGAGGPGCIADWRAGTDILVIRRSSSCAVGDPGCDPLIAGDSYLQVSGCSNTTELGSGNIALYYGLNTNVASLTLHQKDCVTTAPIYQYLTRIYFVANNDAPGDGIPTLKRAELGPNGFSIVPIVEGIENLQIEYGLDTATPTTGSPAVYTADPDSFNGCAPAACVAYWRTVVAAKLYVLARNTSTTPGYTDSKAYTLGLTAAGVPNSVPASNDGFKRHVYQSLVRLNNVAGRDST